MKHFSVDAPISIYEVPNHAEIKDILLSLIDAAESMPTNSDLESISRSDWAVPDDVQRPYQEVVRDALLPTLSQFCSERKAGNLNMRNFWFQQYENTGDTHGWHVHPGSMYNLVYYVELPEGAPGTELYTEQVAVQPPVKEGDVIIFPSFLFHRSPPNTGSGRKTAIVMNVSVENFAG
jgi:hypothetical protein